MGTIAVNEAVRTESHLSHPKYRPDIDGLRAVAILSVVIFHAFPDWLPGGFTGVDVFFVISGFLISWILFENLTHDTFSFTEFYTRRIKRIFPALLLVLATSFLIGWHILLADEFAQLGKHIAAGAGFIANFVFWREAGYFDNAADTKPMLHLWSLGIEEQFYIVWPLLLWLACKRKFNLLAMTALILAVSFYFNVRNAAHDTIEAFFAPQTRFWELLSGSLLAWWQVAKKSSADNRQRGQYELLRRLGAAAAAHKTTVANVLACLGLSLLAFGFLWLDKYAKFPGWYAVIPVLGASLIILAGRDGWINQFILSNPVLVWFGLISFPLYLWHWALLCFVRILEGGTPALPVRLATVALSIVLAWLTYLFLERPIRLRASGKKTPILLACIVFVTGFFGHNAYVRDGLTVRSVVKLNNELARDYDGGDGGNSIPECGITDPAKKSLFKLCAEDRRGNLKYGLLGDSKAGALFPALVRTSTSSGRWLYIGGSTVDATRAMADNKHVEVVVLASAMRSLFQISDGVRGGNFSTYDYSYMQYLAASPNLDRAREFLTTTVSILTQAGKRVFIVVDNPALPNPEDCFERKTSLDFLRHAEHRNGDCYVSFRLFDEQRAPYLKLLDEIQHRYPESVRIFDPTEIYCDKQNDVCGPVRDDRPLYAVTDHISDYAAGLVGKSLNRLLGEE